MAFRSPVTGIKLVRANAKGGLFWYCPDSNGRLLTLVMAKHFLGQDGAREIWVRADLSKSLSENPCPSCAKPMRVAAEPGWMGGGTLDVCRACHLIWVSGEQHDEIPKPDDLIVKGDDTRIGGDSTLVSDAGREIAKQLISEDEKENAGLFDEEPQGFLKTIPGFFGLPVEAKPRVLGATWASWIIGALCFLVFLMTRNSEDIVQFFGFVPDEPLRIFGLTAFTAVFLHAGFAHLLSNLYFFFVFSDDVEDEMGTFEYFFFFLGSCVFVAGGEFVFSGSKSVPHIGLSGFIMSVLAYYALEFGRSKIAFVIPFTQYFSLGRGAGTFLHGFRWLHLPAWVVIGWYFAVDVVLYYFVEKHHLDNTAHSAHIAGALFGLIWWIMYSRSKRERAVDEIGAITSSAAQLPPADRPRLPSRK